MSKGEYVENADERVDADPGRLEAALGSDGSTADAGGSVEVDHRPGRQVAVALAGEAGAGSAARRTPSEGS